ncbi:fibroblast growth factor receptor-like isoform X1 [Apostichopus japonicus]|uniref:fibroblast growth factor receptor-like isoform X1 n=1 Tax=Stichopus japonicus TaxID=307972 RepID=UPI003AB34978
MRTKQAFLLNRESFVLRKMKSLSIPAQMNHSLIPLRILPVYMYKICSLDFRTNSRWSFGIVLWEIYTLGGIPYAGMPAVEVVNRTKAGYRMPQPEGCPMDIFKVMAECWQESPQHRPNFSEIEYALEVILSHRAEISINRQQPSGNPDEAPYLPMVESDASNMIRRDSSLADKINLYDVLGTSADSAFHDLSSTSADSFTTDYQFAGDGVRIEPIIEEEEGPCERRFSISSFQSNPDFVGNGSASSIVSEINSDVSSGESGIKIREGLA